MATDRDYRRLIHDRRWLRLRRDVLTAHPLCRDCEEQGRLTAATEVHHVVPCQSAPTLQAMEALMYDPSNLRPLCHACHLKVHQRLGKGGSREREKRRAQALEQFRRKFVADGTQAEDMGGGMFFESPHHKT